MGNWNDAILVGVVARAHGNRGEVIVNAETDFPEKRFCEGAVLMTRGDQGMWLLANEAEGSLPAAAREVADVTGAGDTVIATMALAMAAGATLTEAARMANEAAGIAVAKFGPSVVTPAELLRAFETSAPSA